MRADVADHCIAVGVWHVEQRLDVLERVLKDAVGRHALPPEEGVQAGPAQRSVVFRSQEACRVMQPLHAEAPALRQVHLQRRPEAVPAGELSLGVQAQHSLQSAIALCLPTVSISIQTFIDVNGVVVKAADSLHVDH